jgi:hypothetical protein
MESSGGEPALPHNGVIGESGGITAANIRHV